MIPDYNPDNGFLPEGIYDATWEEFCMRYGYTQQRRDLLNGLLSALKDLKSCGCKVIWADGSFITVKRIPGDIDVCWQLGGVDIATLKTHYPIFFDFTNKRKAQKDKYGCEFFPAESRADNLGKPYLTFFQSSKDGQTKGIVKINIENI